MFGKEGPTLFELLHQALVSTRQGYDLLAPKFDRTPFRTPDELLAPAIAALGPVDAALDICCGTGAAMHFLRPVCRKRLVGLDFSAGMLEQAKQKLAGADYPPTVEFIETDVESMDFSEEFDAATCFGALGHIPPGEETAFLRRVHHALKPGGRFVFLSAYPPRPLSPVNIVLRTFNTVMKIRNALRKPPFIMFYLTFLLPDIVRELEQAGFTVEVRPDLFPAPYTRYCLVLATRS